MERGIVKYDGYCILCSRTVQWMIRNDRKKRFVFEPLQQQQIPGFSLLNLDNASSWGDTVILYLDGRVYERSSAALGIALRLRFPWPLLGVFFLVPRFIRDPVYDVVARNRKGWFGVRTSCYLP